ncbi:MAG: S8 family peptidase [Nitrospira defluvii]|nr:S8 family peptidase [Nitrospira defluvii]
MPIDPSKPLLRLSISDLQQRPTGNPRIPPRPERFSVDRQRSVFGPKFERLASVLARDQTGLELRSDPSAIAPERLLVFEVRGSIQPFINAIRRLPGLELIDEEELEGDEQDKKPTLYLLVPDAQALRNISSLWHRWIQGQVLGTGFTPWRDVFSTLRDIRPWGPQDRLMTDERNIIAEEIADKDDSERVRIEIELVFRAHDARAREAEAELSNAIVAAEGQVISRCRIADIGYHAILIELPVVAVRSIIEMSPASIAGLDPVMHIRPQSLATSIDVAGSEDIEPENLLPIDRPPILALLDGVPVAQHPLLLGALDVEDQFGLEPSALVSDRHHGTAMASLIVRGDRNKNEEALGRRIHMVPVLGANDRFPVDRLVIDMIYQAVTAMRQGDEPSAPDILLINLSLGNTRKPFHGQMSAWARLIDRLSYRFGILFIISAGNHRAPFDVPGFATFTQFESSSETQRASGTISALGQLLSERRLLSPAESVNGVTVGAANVDAVSPADRRLARGSIDPFPSLTTSNPSSALGPGFANSVKPDILMPGSREHVSFVTTGSALSVRPNGPARAHGLKVAAPPRNGVESVEHFTNGTSAAAALASRACHQIHDSLEAAYGEEFTSLSQAQRATLLKALLVHTASWPLVTSQLIKEVLGPADNRLHVRQKDNIRRFLGYGFVDADAAISCTEDRATFWATGNLPREQAVTVQVPIPICINGQARHHALFGTLAWFTPVLPGRQSYRAVRLTLTESDELSALRVESSRVQPDHNQSRRGTVFSRRWEGAAAPIVGANQVVTLTVQREPDQGSTIDEDIPFAVAVTLTMPGIAQIYNEVRARLAIAPRVEIR